MNNTVINEVIILGETNKYMIKKYNESSMLEKKCSAIGAKMRHWIEVAPLKKIMYYNLACKDARELYKRRVQKFKHIKLEESQVLQFYGQ